MTGRTASPRSGVRARSKVVEALAWVGLLLALALDGRLIQVQTRPGEGGLWAALGFGALILFPFACAVGAVVAGRSTRVVIFWLVFGLLLTGFLLAFVPLILPLAMLVAGVVTVARGRKRVARA